MGRLILELDGKTYAVRLPATGGLRRADGRLAELSKSMHRAVELVLQQIAKEGA